jgi:HTH-like domain
MAMEYGRYGYRRVTALLRREGWQVNHKRVERIWRQEGLEVPQKQPKRRRRWLNDGACVRLRPSRRNHVWSYDFVAGRMTDGRAFRMLVIADELQPHQRTGYGHNRLHGVQTQKDGHTFAQSRFRRNVATVVGPAGPGPSTVGLLRQLVLQSGRHVAPGPRSSGNRARAGRRSDRFSFIPLLPGHEVDHVRQVESRCDGGRPIVERGAVAAIYENLTGGDYQSHRSSACAQATAEDRGLTYSGTYSIGSSTVPASPSLSSAPRMKEAHSIPWETGQSGPNRDSNSLNN